eukprot:TRINITY_DN5016_c0_g1_i2.p1 TRINITY_DN5016_c0_g1~~TRINITY_DN5016_c0_g1_i2.p1  ORF type:complete len:431 (-),score=89.97 TRINITY_DN5016_c0_g1_i2:121-1413(-)
MNFFRNPLTRPNIFRTPTFKSELSKNKESVDQKRDEKKADIEDFEFMSVIGKGAFGKVWLAQHKATGIVYAVKELQKKNIVKNSLVEHTQLERDIMESHGTHPYLVSLHYAFQTDDKLYFVLDYLYGGSLFYHLKNSPSTFTEPFVKFYAAEILLALEHLHNHNIIYRDLKLENILFDAQGHAILTDFGLAKKLKKGRTVSFSGTAIYIAPEVLTQEEGGDGHGKSVDWWSFGVMLHWMLTGMPPFFNENVRSLFQMIAHEKVVIEDVDGKLSPEALSLLRGLLTRDVKQRLGCGIGDAQEIKDHPFFAGVKWEAVYDRVLTPPFVPKVKNRMDGFKYLDMKPISKEDENEALAQVETLSVTPRGNEPDTTVPSFEFKQWSFFRQPSKKKEKAKKEKKSKDSSKDSSTPPVVRKTKGRSRRGSGGSESLQ